MRLLALLLMQKELGLFALIGMVLLMALVTKNAILLVNFALISVGHRSTLLKYYPQVLHLKPDQTWRLQASVNL